MLGALLVALLGPVESTDWSQFRGSDWTGRGEVARELPLHWSEHENVRWKAPIPGKGWSSPVVVGEQAWLTTALDNGHSLRAVCVDLGTGAVRHDVEVFAPAKPEPINDRNSHASPTPAADEERVYVHFGTMGTACLDRRTAKILWKNESLSLDHKEGPGSSPILHGGLLIVNCDGMDVQFVTALDKRTGRQAWATKRSAPLDTNPDFRKAYSTPIVVTVNGRTELISPGADQVNAYDPATGKELWRVRYKGFSVVPQPVLWNGLAVVCTDFGKSQLWAVRLGGSGDVTDKNVVWRCNRQTPRKPTPIVVGDSIYMVTDNGGVVTRLDCRTGEPTWQHRLGGNFSASPILVNDKLYLCSEEGKTTVIEPGSTPAVLTTNELAEGHMATPAVAGDSLLLRGTSHLYSIGGARHAAATR